MAKGGLAAGVGGQGLGPVGEGDGPVGLAGQPGRAGRLGQAAAALGVVAGELGRPLEGGRGRGVPTPAPGPVSRAFQLGGGGLVGADGGRGQVPGPLVGGVLAGQDLGQGPVGGLAGGEAGRPVGGRADQGVAEPEPLAGPDQPGGLGLVEGAGVDAEAGAGPEHGRRFAGGLGGRDQQEGPGLLGQAADPLAEAPLQPGGQGQDVPQGRPPGQLAGVERPGQLQQGQGVAAGPLDQGADHGRGQVGPGRGGQQGGRRFGVEPAKAQLGQAVGRELARVAVAGREQQHHPLGLQPAGGEPERLGRGPVQPLGLVDQAEHRAGVGRLGEQAEHGHRDQEAVPAVPLCAPLAGGLETEGAGQGGRLVLGQAPGQPQHRPQQLVEGGEGQLGLGLDPGRPEDGHPLGLPGGMVEQRGLADPGLAADHQDPAARPPGVREQPFQGVALGASAVEHCRDASRPTTERATPPPGEGS